MISVTMSPNEQGSGRDDAIRRTVARDDRFNWNGFETLPADLRVSFGDNAVDIELKSARDMVRSCVPVEVGGVVMVHLADQIRVLAAGSNPAMIWVLDTDEAVRTEIVQSAFARGLRGSDADQALITGWNQVVSVVDMAEGAFIPVHFRGVASHRSLLQVARAVLMGSDLMRHRRRTRYNHLTSMAMMSCIPGIGPTTGRALIDHLGPVWEMVWTLRLATDPEKVLQEVPGVGAKTASRIMDSLRMSGEVAD